MICATFNVLADAYISYGDYSHVDPSLLLTGARTQSTVELIDSLHADVIGLQEAEEPLKHALEQTGNWRTFWSPKERGKVDGCLTIVRHGIEVSAFDTYPYSDQSGHIMQCVRIGQLVFANTHIKWAPADALQHAGVAQTTELLKHLEPSRATIIFADCNDRPNGPVRQLIEKAGFINVCGDRPTALVNQEPVALDLLAVRGITAKRITQDYSLAEIPNKSCPSDHIPIVAELELS